MSKPRVFLTRTVHCNNMFIHTFAADREGESLPDAVSHMDLSDVDLTAITTLETEVCFHLYSANGALVVEACRGCLAQR